MNRISYIFFLSLWLFSCEKPISEFQSQNFVKYFGNGTESKGNDVIQLTDGTYVLTGYDKSENGNYQLFAARVDENGNLIWSNTFGASAREEGKIIREVADGFLVAGTSTIGSGLTHSFIMKISASGDSLWYKEFGDPNISIVVNDIALNENSIFIAGQSLQAGNSKTDYYIAKLDLLGDQEWEVVSFRNSNSSFTKVFLHEENAFFIGTDGTENKISINVCLQNSGITINFSLLESVNESVADATIIDDQLYILANFEANNNSYTRIEKLTPEFEQDANWRSERINSVSGKAFTYSEDKTLCILGESTLEGNSLINAIKIDELGSAEYGAESFRTLQGTVGNVNQTADNGLILIGTTNATFGARIQLIKTDKDLFLLKP